MKNFIRQIAEHNRELTVMGPGPQERLSDQMELN